MTVVESPLAKGLKALAEARQRAGIAARKPTRHAPPPPLAKGEACPARQVSRLEWEMARLVAGFEVQDQHVYRIVRAYLDWTLKLEHWQDEPAEMHVAEAVYLARKLTLNLTAAQHYELERWIDFLPDAYEKQVQYHATFRYNRKRKGGAR